MVTRKPSPQALPLHAVRLSPAEREQVTAARSGAILALRSELDVELAPELVSELGLPGRQSALTQLDALTMQLLARA